LGRRQNRKVNIKHPQKNGVRFAHQVFRSKSPENEPGGNQNFCENIIIRNKDRIFRTRGRPVSTRPNCGNRVNVRSRKPGDLFTLKRTPRRKVDVGQAGCPCPQGRICRTAGARSIEPEAKTEHEKLSTPFSNRMDHPRQKVGEVRTWDEWGNKSPRMENLAGLRKVKIQCERARPRNTGRNRLR